MLLGQFHRRCLAFNHGCSAFCSHRRRSFSDLVLWPEGVSGPPIHQKFSAQHVNRVLTQQSVNKWTENLKKLSHKCYAWGRGRAPVHGHKLGQHWAYTWRGSVRVTIDEEANRLQISHGSAYEIIQDRLGFHKVCARWIPKITHNVA
jgi:hypothetical protein